MVRLVFLFAVVIIEYVYGRPRSLPPLPTLPTKGEHAAHIIYYIQLNTEEICLHFPPQYPEVTRCCICNN